MPSLMNFIRLQPDDKLLFTKGVATSSSPSKSELNLTNTSQTDVAFKIKTTAPKSYLVRPNSGTLRPKEMQTVVIILQPQGTDVSADAHRFLVQAVAAPSEENVFQKQWADFGKDEIQEHRLSVVWEAREDANVPETYADLKAKYDNLLHWSLDVERQENQLKRQITQLQQKGSGGAETKAGFSMLHLILVALLVFACSCVAQVLIK